MSTESKSLHEHWRAQRTLPGTAYVSSDVFAEEMSTIFAQSWVCVGRVEEAPHAGDYLVRELCGESMIVVHGSDDRFHAYYNVCRHRGTRLCDRDGHVAKVITCPYHAWSYRVDDGALVRTPNVGADESLDRSQYPLVGIRCAQWEGFLFVNLRDNGRSLLDALEDDPECPTQFSRFRLAELRTGRWGDAELAANWKIVVENYHECLHCPGVHPELVRVIPTYRSGSVGDDPDSWGVPLADGATSLTRSGRSRLPTLQGLDAKDLGQYYGCYVFPNLFLDFSSDCVTFDIMFPRAPDRVWTHGGYLFDAAAIASAGFDAAEVIEFGDLVTAQDIAVCERVQKGMGSIAYAEGGVFPYQDRFVHAFVERYLTMMKNGAASSG